jgi:hypothetical protein
MVTQQNVLDTLNKVFAARPTLWVELNRRIPVSEEQKLALLTLMGEQPGIEELFNGTDISVWGITQLICEAGFRQRLGAKVNTQTGRVHSFLWQGSRQFGNGIKSDDMEDGSYDDEDDDDEDEEE